ncbi:hypothetical protein AAFG07_27455 [Bradyrhizobium sp. B097]
MIRLFDAALAVAVFCGTTGAALITSERNAQRRLSMFADGDYGWHHG